MNKFTIEANGILKQNIKAYYHTNFYGSKNFLDNPNYLYKFKNDPHHNWSDQQLRQAILQFKRVLRVDLPEILKEQPVNSLTICVIPRAKAENTYTSKQLLFRATVKSVVEELPNFIDGTDYIKRHTSTKTTHLRKPIEGFINDGEDPYKGITRDTCHISNNIIGKDILLIDDIYTRSVNIDEDAIQTLLDMGARNVIFYAIGKTV